MAIANKHHGGNVMFCPKCGAQNPEGVMNCVSCGSPMQAGAPAYVNNTQKVPNYLVWSILATIFCCNPIGIVGIIFASQVDGKLSTGDYNGAVESSKKAKLFTWIAVGTTLGIALLWVIFVVVLSIIGSMSGGSQY